MTGRVWRAVVFGGSVALLLAMLAAPVQAASSGNHNNNIREAKGVRHRPVALANASAQSLGPTVDASQNGDQQGRALRANFDGVSSLDSEITNFGGEFEPPDQGLCVGNGFVVEMVNSAFRVYDLHGNSLQGPLNVNVPFSEDPLAFTSDPRCHFDKATNTWFAIIIFIDFIVDPTDPDNITAFDSHLDVAYNTTGDPTTPWSVFRLDTTDQTTAATPQCPCFGDQPRLGIDANNIYVSADEFPTNFEGTDFYGGEIDVISKADLVAHKANPHTVHYGHLANPDGSLSLGIEPALTFGPAPAEYFLESLDSNRTPAGDNRIVVWALSDVNRVDQGGTPTLSSVTISSEAYAKPPAALQKDGGTQFPAIDSGDDRMQQTQFIDGEIWGELTTALTPRGDTALRAGAAWFRVKPHLGGDTLSGATLKGQGYVAVKGAYVIYPALQVDGGGNGAMVFTVTSSQMFPSAAYSVFGENSSGFSKPIIAAAGSGPYLNNSFRWGDYSWAVLDQPTDTVWMATEYMPPASSQTTDGVRPWGTRVIALSLQ